VLDGYNKARGRSQAGAVSGVEVEHGDVRVCVRDTVDAVAVEETGVAEEADGRERGRGASSEGGERDPPCRPPPP
jgi:hypothetical protein